MIRTVHINAVSITCDLIKQSGIQFKIPLEILNGQKITYMYPVTSDLNG